MSRTDDDNERSMPKAKSRERSGQRREWLERGFPDPSYDPDQGWSLGQFVAHVAPDLLRQHMSLEEDVGLPPIDQQYHLYRTFDWWGPFAAKVKELLLDNLRFRITGYRPGAYEPQEIPPVLIRDMVPDCIASELTEMASGPPFRRFEKVRVFLRSEPKKASGGRKATYDWPTLKSEMERDPPIISRNHLVEYCRTNVKVIRGKKGSPHGPDDKTVREAILKYGFDNLIKDPPGN